MINTINKLQLADLKLGPYPKEYFMIDNLNIEELKSLKKFVIKKSSYLKSSTSIMGHVLNKPYGYAGDFKIIDRIYTHDCSKEYLNWDIYSLDNTAAKAVRNRKEYFKSLIATKTASNKSVQLLNIASGPARDLKEAYERIDQGHLLQSTCVEMDSNAIEYAKEITQNSKEHIRFIHKNIFRFQTDQKYDLIWSAGLFDYFEDKAFVLLLRRFKDWLNIGGEIVIGNFNEDHNPSRAYMEILGDWHLHHRAASQLIALALEAGFEKNKITVGREEENVNLFLHLQG